MTQKIKKTYLKTWAVRNFYQYNIFEVDAGGLKWLIAEPLTKGLATRCAEDERVLRIFVENDCINYIKFQQRVK